MTKLCLPSNWPVFLRDAPDQKKFNIKEKSLILLLLQQERFHDLLTSKVSKIITIRNGMRLI